MLTRSREISMLCSCVGPARMTWSQCSLMRGAPSNEVDGAETKSPLVRAVRNKNDAANQFLLARSGRDYVKPTLLQLGATSRPARLRHRPRITSRSGNALRLPNRYPASLSHERLFVDVPQNDQAGATKSRAGIESKEDCSTICAGLLLH